MLRQTVQSPSGHKAVVETKPTEAGWVVQMRAWYRGVMTPAVTLAHFHGAHSEANADRYATNLRAAIIGLADEVKP